jgi:hypothetical protein
MKGFGRIALRIWLCAACGQILVLLGFFNSIQQARHAEIEHTLQTLVSIVLEPASARAALGIPLRYQTKLQREVTDLAGRVHDADLYIVDPSGIIVFSSNKTRVGGTAPAPWLKPPEPGRTHWVADIGGDTIVAARVANFMAQNTGTIVAMASRRSAAMDALVTLAPAAAVSVLFITLMGLLVTTGTILSTRPLTGHLQRIAERYGLAAAAMLRGTAIDTEAAPAGIAMTAAIQNEFAKIHAEAESLDRIDSAGGGA